MEILEVIKNRRSVRKYKDKAPSGVEIERILSAGQWAPSGLNNQPWRFLVIKDKSKKDGLAKFTESGNIVKNAPAVILVFLALEDVYNRDKDLMAIGGCIQSMCLEAHSLGIGTCWLGEILNKKDEVLRYLNLGKNLELAAVITLGYPDEKNLKGERKELKKTVISSKL